MNTASYSHELEVGKKIALQAGAIMRDYFDSDLLIERKEDDSPLTVADTKINRLVIEELGKEFKDGVIGEEESTTGYGNGRKWICDPIDGTKAFSWGVPTAMFSLGLVVDGKPVLGVAYDPFLDRMYTAIVGAGSFCNDTPIKVSLGMLAGEYVGVSSSAEQALKDSVYADLVTSLLGKKARLACFSGAVYKSCLVAKGKLVGYLERGVSAHDMAAAHVIVEEAGGKVTDFNGGPLDYSKPFSGAIVSNGRAHAELVACVASSEK